MGYVLALTKAHPVPEEDALFFRTAYELSGPGSGGHAAMMPIPSRPSRRRFDAVL